MSKRKPGEKNYADDHTRIYTLATPLPPPVPGKYRERFDVEQVASTPPSYVVRDTKGNEWYVMTTADGELEIVESSDETYHNVKAWVKKAVKRHREQNY